MFYSLKNSKAVLALVILILLFVAYQIAKIAISLAVVYFVVIPITLAYVNRERKK